MYLAKTVVHTLTPCILHEYSCVLTNILYGFVNPILRYATGMALLKTIRHHSSERHKGHDSLTAHPEKESVTTAVIRMVGVRILAVMNARILHSS